MPYTGILGSTLLIISTTIDDAIWLIPYTTSPHLPKMTKIIHALTFLFTLEFLSIGCVGVYTLMEYYLRSTLNHSSSTEENDETAWIMELFGALLCWSIAIFLFVKKLIKRRKKKRRMELLEQEEQLKLLEQPCVLGPANHSTLGESLALSSTSDGTYGTYEFTDRSRYSYDSKVIDDEEGTNKVNVDYDNTDNIPTTPSVWMVISLTTLGALDEISYFPALIMGHIFTPFQLCLGAFLAGYFILIVIVFFLAQFQPLVDFLDRIPLYGIVGMFAIILTAGLFLKM